MAQSRGGDESSEETHPLLGPAVCFTVCERWACREGCVAGKNAEQSDFLLDFLEQDAGTNKLSATWLHLER